MDRSHVKCSYQKKKKKSIREHKEVLGGKENVSTLVVVIEWVYAYAQTHQDVYIKYMQIFVYQLCLNKT